METSAMQENIAVQGERESARMWYLGWGGRQDLSVKVTFMLERCEPREA